MGTRLEISPRESILMAVHSSFSSVGGAEIQARTLCNGLIKRGWKVELVALAEAGRPVSPSYDLALPTLKVSQIAVPQIPRLAGLLLMFRFALFLYRERKSYQVIHVHIMKTMAFVASVVGKAMGKKVVLKVSGIDELEYTTLSEKHKRKLLHRIVNWGCRKADLFIAVSQRTASRLRTFGYESSKIVYLPNGVDVERFAPRGEAEESAPRHFKGASHVAVFVGRFAPEKGLYDLLQAFAAVRREFPESVLCLVGDGRLRRGLEAMAGADRLLKGGVHFAGETGQVQDFLRRADCYVCSSFEEGLSNTMLEAMACGLPIVSTAVSGAEDLIEDGVNGYLVPLQCPAQLAAAMIKVFADQSHAKRMGEAARRKALELFDIARVVDRYEELYLSLAQ